MTDKEKTCKAVCGTDTPCKKFCDFAKNYYKGLIAGRKEREDEIKQVEKENERIKKQWHDCFLSCSSPYCAAHFPAVKMQGELGNMSKREPED